MVESKKVCPDCAETVMAAARVCKHCGYRFDTSVSAPRSLEAGPPLSHPKAGVVLVLGVLGFFTCGLLSWVAWIYGNKVRDEMDLPGSNYSNVSTAETGRILGMIGALLCSAGLVAVLWMMTQGGGSCTGLDC